MPKEKPAWATPPEPIDPSLIRQTFEADVVVVGAGHAGTAAARAAAEGGASVALLETMAEDKYFAWGIDFGHINSRFLAAQGVPAVDPLEFYNDWQLRSGNRCNPALVMQFARHGGACFDWLLEALTPQQQASVEVRFWPPMKTFQGSLNGMKSWVGTATFPEAKWDQRGITNAVMASIRAAEKAGAKVHWRTAAQYLEKEHGRVTAVIAKNREGQYLRFRAGRGVVLAAGDFGGNREMVRDLCDELVTLWGEEQVPAGGRNGLGVRMGVWAGGRVVPGPIATMGGNGAMLETAVGATATLWLDPDCQRFCNEGFGDSVFSVTEAARRKRGKYVSLFCGSIYDQLQAQAPVHGAVWVSNPADPKAARAFAAIEGARQAGHEGYDISTGFQPPASAIPPGGLPGGGKQILHCADTLEALADDLGYTGDLKERFLRSIERYNQLCAGGRDEDFGKDPSLLFPMDTPPYFGIQSQVSGSMMMVTVDGLLTDDHQAVVDAAGEPIPGLWATGNCCGRRFGIQYSTPVSGVSIGIAWTLGMLLGRELAKNFP